jgi:predicted amidohydrolase
MVVLLKQAKERGCELVVFPELALTTFFPRWYLEDEAGIDRFFDNEMPNRDTEPLFDHARTLQVGFYLGYAEKVVENGRVRRFNTSILVARCARS